MKLLVYYNVLHKNFYVVFKDLIFDEYIGQYYKVNSLLVSIIDIPEKYDKKRRIKFKFSIKDKLRLKFGNFLLKLSLKVLGRLPVTRF